jgi:hypothetical protein
MGALSTIDGEDLDVPLSIRHRQGPITPSLMGDAASFRSS